jgi:hypothetical protein
MRKSSLSSPAFSEAGEFITLKNQYVAKSSLGSGEQIHELLQIVRRKSRDCRVPLLKKNRKNF